MKSSNAEKMGGNDDDDDDELFLWYGGPTKGVLPYFQPGPLSEIHTIANLRHAASRQATERGCSIVKCGKMLSVGGL